MTEYKFYRSKLRGLIRTSELNYFRQKFSNACHNLKKAWSVINSIRCKKKSLKFPSFVDINSTIVTNRRMICKEFNDYFVNVANDMNNTKYKSVSPPDYRMFLSEPVESSIFLSDITEDEISEIIKQLDNSKSCDISPCFCNHQSILF